MYSHVRPKNSELETHANECKYSFKKDIYIAVIDKGIVNSKNLYHNRNQNSS